MRWTKSLLYAAVLRRGMATLGSASLAASVLLCGSVAAADVTANHVRDVQVLPDDGVTGGARIEIVGTGAPAYNVRVADGGARLFVDLSESDVVGAPAAITTPVGVVGGVLTQSYPTGSGPMTRADDQLAARVDLSRRRQRFHARGPHRPERPRDPVLSRAQAPPTPSAAGAVRDVRFERSPATVTGCAPNGCDRVVVDLGSIPTYSLSTSASGNLRLELRGTGLPEALAAHARRVAVPGLAQVDHRVARRDQPDPRRSSSIARATRRAPSSSKGAASCGRSRPRR